MTRKDLCSFLALFHRKHRWIAQLKDIERAKAMEDLAYLSLVY